MAEEAVAQAGALVRALDQAGDVGQHELLVADIDDAEVGLQGREGIVGDLGLGARTTRPGRSTCRRWAGPTSPASAISFSRSQTQRSSPGQPGSALARRAVGRGLEVGVAEAAVAAAQQDDALAGLGQVGEHGLLVLVAASGCRPAP